MLFRSQAWDVVVSVMVEADALCTAFSVGSMAWNTANAFFCKAFHEVRFAVAKPVN